MENKEGDDDLFDRLSVREKSLFVISSIVRWLFQTSDLNQYLSDLMKGLTAKVFRTYNASKTLQDELDSLTDPSSTIPEKLLAYNRANRQVALLCNHQRSVPKTFGKSMETLKAKVCRSMYEDHRHHLMYSSRSMRKNRRLPNKNRNTNVRSWIIKTAKVNPRRRKWNKQKRKFNVRKML